MAIFNHILTLLEDMAEAEGIILVKEEDDIILTTTIMEYEDNLRISVTQMVVVEEDVGEGEAWILQTYSNPNLDLEDLLYFISSHKKQES